MAYFEQIKPLDGTILFSGAVANTGAGSAISTQYYGSVSIQVTGSDTSSINAQIEGSNDGITWDPLLIQNVEEIPSVTDTINIIDSSYSLKTTHLYIRYNVSYYTGAPNIIIVGRSGSGVNGADFLTAAFNPDTPLQVNLTGGVKRDSDGALILSDAYFTIKPPGTLAGTTYTLDVTGYSSWTFISAGSGGTSAGPTFSGDGVFFGGAVNYSTPSNNGSGTSSGIASGGGIFNGPIYGKFMRFTAQASFFGTFIFKQTPPTLSVVSLNSISGTAPVNAGVGGTIAVGGNIAVGSAPTLNPITIGGSDLTGLTRRLLTDVSGRPFFNALSPYFASLTNPTSTTISSSNSPGANTSLPINTVGSIPATYQQSAALNVQDTSQHEGQNTLELLAQMLLELRILNQQMYELPRLIANKQESNDPPEIFRQEPSIFNQ